MGATPPERGAPPQKDEESLIQGIFYSVCHIVSLLSPKIRDDTWHLLFKGALDLTCLGLGLGVPGILSDFGGPDRI
ncbi:hypothetical protein DUNSADRAFT_8637 [Dunaliella salina]|uniref:Uncharacterized protein n=1 Tax=Dunaliella salina TaxID=3046 RepID=A0ABQ7H5V0_DUNSA|nr:hypothetical protein DUNSADRAFT_8637 [Dunaliella salina]|eukprot:KAF5842238.1 hypothetical protein DUNSADRAFT_8637 [Dunaliella salina]